jgi:ParE toxin of type II toxin-antitoxin system, parDE
MRRMAHNPEVEGSNPSPATKARGPFSNRERAFCMWFARDGAPSDHLPTQLLPPMDDRSSARRGTYRVIYRIDDKARVVTVVDITHRRCRITIKYFSIKAAPPRPTALAPGCGPRGPTRHGAPGNNARSTDQTGKPVASRRSMWARLPRRTSCPVTAAASRAPAASHANAT